MSAARDLKVLELLLARGALGARIEGPRGARGNQLEREADALGEALARLAATDAPEPPPALRERMLAATRPDALLDGFAQRMARLLDWPLARAQDLLRAGCDPRSTSWIDGPASGIRIRPLEPGPQHGPAVAGLVWCEPGSRFPAHRHRGAEWALVLSGHAVNSGGEHWSVGDRVHQPAGSAHSFAVPEGGVPLLAAVVVRGGFDLV